MLTTDTPLAQLLSIAIRAREPAETGAVPDARRHGDDRHAHEAADDARQRPFHAGDDDDDARGGQAGVLGEEPMESCDADVVEPIDDVAHQLGRDRRLFRDRQVGRASGGHDDRAAAGWQFADARA